MKPLRFGVVGCGAISTLFQLPALKGCPQVSLQAVTDLDLAHAKSVASKFGAKTAFASHRDLVGRVDAALVATPNTTHADIACELLEQGIHVLCEKPMATTRGEAERMFAAADKGGARLMAAHCLRFSPNLAMIKQVIERGWIGEVVEFSGAIGGPYEQGLQRTDFRRKKALAGGGAVIDLGIHLIDLAIWYTGAAPQRIAYEAQSAEGWEVENHAEIAIAFDDDRRASIACSFAQFLANALTVRGSHGHAGAGLYTPTIMTAFGETGRIFEKAGMQTLSLPERSMYDAQIEHFCRSIDNGQEFIVKREEVVASIATVQRCYAQAGAIAA